MRRRAVLALVLALGLLAVPFARAADEPNYDVLIVLVGKKFTKTTLGSHCRPGPDGTPGACTSAHYPLKTTAKVTLRRGGSVQALVATQANYVRWRTARIDSKGREQITAYGEAKIVKGWNRRWRIQIPKKLSKSTKVIAFDVLYPNAYSSFEVGARVVNQRTRRSR